MFCVHAVRAKYKAWQNINILIIEKTLKITVSAGIRQLNRYDLREKGAKRDSRESFGTPRPIP